MACSLRRFSRVDAPVCLLVPKMEFMAAINKSNQRLGDETRQKPSASDPDDLNKSNGGINRVDWQHLVLTS